MLKKINVLYFCTDGFFVSALNAEENKCTLLLYRRFFFVSALNAKEKNVLYFDNFPGKLFITFKKYIFRQYNVLQ